ncbi:MAG: DUF4924 family protein [Petrimonas sp.]|nr:DUF4924 family protein [Petrimonas sp.]
MNAPNKQDNIAEYLLYMWQIEDLLRVYELDIDKIEKNLIAPMNLSEEDAKEARDWYEGLILMMKSENVQHDGHLQVNKNILIDLTDAHLRLLNNPQESAYIATYYKTLPHIVALRAKSEKKDVTELETCLTALYGYLLLKLQKKEISAETQQAVEQIRNLLRLLAEKYKTIDKEEIE